MFDGTAPMPPCPDCAPPGPIESFLGVVLSFWLLFFLVVYILPPKYGDAIWKVAFPFMPRKGPPPEDTSK